MVRNMPPACVCSAGDGNGKINCNTASRDDNGLCPDMGGVYGNPRPLRTPSATSPRDGGHSPSCHHSASIASASVSVGCCSRARLILEIDISERLPVMVAHDEAGVLFLDRPRRREAALGHDWIRMPALPSRRLVGGQGLRGCLGPSRSAK